MDSNSLLLVVMLVLIGGLFYFSSRTRKRQAAAQAELRDSVVPGTRVTTIAGLQATVTAVADDTIELEIAPGVRTTWLRAAVRDVIVDAPEPEPAIESDRASDNVTLASLEDGAKKDFS